MREQWPELAQVDEPSQQPEISSDIMMALINGNINAFDVINHTCRTQGNSVNSLYDEDGAGIAKRGERHGISECQSHPLPYRYGLTKQFR